MQSSVPVGFLLTHWVIPLSPWDSLTLGCPPPVLTGSPITGHLLHSETLPVEHLGGKPLCMNQYYQILSSCRVPGPKQDSVVNFGRDKKPPTHIIVVHNYQVGAGPPTQRPPSPLPELTPL